MNRLARRAWSVLWTLNTLVAVCIVTVLVVVS